ncbi:alpha mannosidase-like protein [Mycena olivaceomarginata]|nr:alpha mannosidase-like protein [Mycena olivaceomarginata]
MNLTKWWPQYLLALLVVALEGSKWVNKINASPLKSSASGWTSQRKLAAREKTRDLWYHGFDRYMTFAFPLDELCPLSCTGQGPDWERPENYAANDVAGNFSLTLVDVLDTLVVLGDRSGFEQAVKDVIQWVSFDVNTRPQVFETTIRVLGGLLSGHIFASQEGHPFFLPWYRGELLELAHDLGERLLPAFSTPTGLPYARINLRRGVLKGEGIETCSAGAGSLLLEFGTLSRLTGDDRFEKAAHKAFFAVWNRRSDIGLVGNTINIRSGEWTKPEISGIGAGIDSFHEYALKWYIMSGDIEFLDVWDDTFAAIMRWSRAPDGFWYRPVNMNTGETAFYTVDSLSAFWPGLQVLAGDVQSAIKIHMMYYNLWRKHSGLPEVYDTNVRVATSHQYPLRPELIESTWYLYRATRDPFYLDVGERILFDITTRAKVPCGLTGIKDLRTNSRDDRMESFALYLFLLFDEENPLHKDDSNYVFTTEGHILTLGRQHLKPTPPARRKMRNIETHQCPAYRPFLQRGSSGLTMGIRSRGDVDYARELVAQPAKRQWGWCERPVVNLFAYDFILSANSKAVAEDLSPSRLKVDVLDNGYIIHNVTGIRVHIVQRLDGKGYDIRKLGHYNVRAGHVVYINDSTIFGPPDPDAADVERALDIPPALLHAIYGPAVGGADRDPRPAEHDGRPHDGLHGAVRRRSSGLPPKATSRSCASTTRVASRSTATTTTRTGVSRTSSRSSTPPSSCTAGSARFCRSWSWPGTQGAAGVFVISDEDAAMNPTADATELEEAGDLGDVGLAVLTPQVGQLVHDMLDSTEERGGPGRAAGGSRAAAEKEKAHKILYLNGHPLLNTRLLI